LNSPRVPDPKREEVGGVDTSAGNAGVRPAGSRAAPPASLFQLVDEWRQSALEYDRRDREATLRKEYIIAAQQAGLACCYRVCANALETRLRLAGLVGGS